MENKNFEQKNNLSWIDDKIKNVVKHPISKEDLDRLDKNEEKGGLTQKDYQDMVQATKNSRIDLNFLHEYKYLLTKLGYSKNQTDEILAHENAHANMGDSLGVEHKGYSVIIFNDHGILKVRQFTLHKFPENWDIAKTRLVSEKIANGS